MNNKFIKLLVIFFKSFWPSTITSLASLSIFSLIILFNILKLSYIANIFFIILVIIIIGKFITAIIYVVKKQWKIALGQFIHFCIIGTITVAVILILSIYLLFGPFGDYSLLFGPSEDGFADSLTIPKNINLVIPDKELESTLGDKEDKLQHILIDSLNRKGNDNPNLKVNIENIIKLKNQNIDVLKQYLAISPAWRLFSERGNLFATRRLKIGNNWNFTLHGYYTLDDIDIWNESGIEDFQFRLTFGFSGSPWARKQNKSTILHLNENVEANLSIVNQMYESHSLIESENFLIEIFEQSKNKERRLTKATLNYINNEFSILSKYPARETIFNNISKNSIKYGKPLFTLRKCFQPGLYDSIIWINPGEPGMIYLKAYEVTKNTPLSVDTLKEESNEYVGWSTNQNELFFSNTHFTIYEGDWGKPYAARFEVWFIPESGKAEKKIIENIFKIEGWER